MIDRSILLELVRIPEEERKEESQLWAVFERDKPLILGGALKVLAEAMSLYPNIKLSKLHRMADFTRWGYAIAEAAQIQGGGERFLTAYQANIERANAVAIESHPVAAAIVALMRQQSANNNTSTWKGTIAGLLDVLEHTAFTERVNTRNKLWPRGAHILTRRMNEVKSNLEKMNIYFDIRHAGYAKEITIEWRSN